MSKSNSKGNKFKYWTINILCIILVVVIIICGYQIWSINNNYVQEKKVHDDVMNFKPSDNGPGGSGSLSNTDNSAGQETGAPGPDGWLGTTVWPGTTKKPGTAADNQSIYEAAKKNPDTVGWITIKNTKIDYPFLQRINEVVDKGHQYYYIDHDFNNKKAKAGSIFMDYRNNRDFSNFNTIIYGHHMNNGSMFGTLKNFADRDFFNKNTTGTIYLADRNYTLQIFAYLVINIDVEEDINMIYGTINYNNAGEYLKYVKEKAKQYRDIGVTANQKVVTLSTCTNVAESGRTILIARLA